MTPLVELARALAQYAHQGQVDKSGNDYFTAHVEPIAQKMALDGYADEYVVTAYLHDVVEDCEYWFSDVIEALFGDEVYEAVEAVTRNHFLVVDDETYMEYLERVKANKIAKRVKYYDIQNNLAHGRMEKLDVETRTRLKIKYASALGFLQEPSDG